MADTQGYVYDSSQDSHGREDSLGNTPDGHVFDIPDNLQVVFVLGNGARVRAHLTRGRLEIMGDRSITLHPRSGNVVEIECQPW